MGQEAERPKVVVSDLFIYTLIGCSYFHWVLWDAGFASDNNIAIAIVIVIAIVNSIVIAAILVASFSGHGVIVNHLIYMHCMASYRGLVPSKNILIWENGIKWQMRRYGKEQDKRFSRSWSEKDYDGSCHKNGWSTHSEASTTVGSRRIQEKTWKTKDKLDRHSEQGLSKNGINLGRGWSISSRQTDLASTCGPVHRRCWINQVKLI